MSTTTQNSPVRHFIAEQDRLDERRRQIEVNKYGESGVKAIEKLKQRYLKTWKKMTLEQKMSSPWRQIDYNEVEKLKRSLAEQHERVDVPQNTDRTVSNEKQRHRRSALRSKNNADSWKRMSAVIEMYKLFEKLMLPKDQRSRHHLSAQAYHRTSGEVSVSQRLVYLGSRTEETNEYSDFGKPKTIFLFKDKKNRRSVNIHQTKLVVYAPKFKKGATYRITHDKRGRAYSISDRQKQVYVSGSRIIEMDNQTGQSRVVNAFSVHKNKKS